MIDRLCFSKTAAIILAVSLSGSQAMASGYWNVAQGASNHARGGANLAATADPIAILLNPAALAGHRGLQLTFGGDLIDDNRGFDRADAADEWDLREGEFDSVTNQLELARAPSPHLFASYNMAAAGLEQLTVGLGAWGPPRSDQLYAGDGAQRYSGVENHNVQAFVGLAAAYELPWKKLRLGATALMIHTVVDIDLTLNTQGPSQILCSQREDKRCDIKANVNASESFIPGGIFGISFEPVDGIVVAATYQLPFDLAASGKLTTEFGSAFKNGLASLEGDEIDLDAKMPALASAAILYQGSDFEVEVAYLWEQWSRNDVVKMLPKGIVQRSTLQQIDGVPLAPIELQNRFQDSHSFRLGGHYVAVADLLTVRAGAYYETSAVPDEYLSAANLDMAKVGLTAGGRVELPADLWVDFAVGYATWSEVTVTDTKVVLDDLLAGDDPESAVEPHPIGNGTYSNQQLVFMAALGAHFDI